MNAAADKGGRTGDGLMNAAATTTVKKEGDGTATTAATAQRPAVRIAIVATDVATESSIVACLATAPSGGTRFEPFETTEGTADGDRGGRAAMLRLVFPSPSFEEPTGATATAPPATHDAPQRVFYCSQPVIATRENARIRRFGACHVGLLVGMSHEDEHNTNNATKTSADRRASAIAPSASDFTLTAVNRGGVFYAMHVASTPETILIKTEGGAARIADGIAHRAEVHRAAATVASLAACMDRATRWSAMRPVVRLQGSNASQNRKRLRDTPMTSSDVGEEIVFLRDAQS